ncbi:HMG1/2-like protein [Artemisia annua]|uniref:HMG1/2-like protein n=1 Tax=Artemisia annua TaxID=35608 RepID=A0A2U1PUC6_ARTAN|nr:HMG1/2-like protein [Artemisia annua]
MAAATNNLHNAIIPAEIDHDWGAEVLLSPTETIPADTDYDWAHVQDVIVKKITKAKVIKKEKAPGAPKRPPSAFFEGFKENFPDNKSVVVVAKEGGAKWKAMSESEKAPYVEKAASKKEEYAIALKLHNFELNTAMFIEIEWRSVVFFESVELVIRIGDGIGDIIAMICIMYHTCLGETLNDLIQMKNSTKKRMQEALTLAKVMASSQAKVSRRVLKLKRGPRRCPRRGPRRCEVLLEARP